MGIVLKKKLIVADEVAVDPLLSDFAQTIDEAGAAELEVAKIQKKIKDLQSSEIIKKYKELQDLLAAKIEELGADDDAKIEQLGERFRLEAGTKGTSRSITDMKAIHKLMGDDLFYSCATITLKDVDAYLTKPQRDKVLKEDRTKRTLKIVARK